MQGLPNLHPRQQALPRRALGPRHADNESLLGER